LRFTFAGCFVSSPKKEYEVLYTVLQMIASYPGMDQRDKNATTYDYISAGPSRGESGTSRVLAAMPKIGVDGCGIERSRAGTLPPGRPIASLGAPVSAASTRLELMVAGGWLFVGHRSLPTDLIFEQSYLMDQLIERLAVRLSGPNRWF